MLEFNNTSDYRHILIPKEKGVNVLEESEDNLYRLPIIGWHVDDEQKLNVVTPLGIAQSFVACDTKGVRYYIHAGVLQTIV